MNAIIPKRGGTYSDLEKRPDIQKMGDVHIGPEVTYYSTCITVGRDIDIVK